jgi:hypothetical protein
MVKGEILRLFMFIFTLYVVLLKANVATSDRNKVYTMFDLHLHVENFMLDHLLRAISIRMGYSHRKSFFFRVFKAIAFVKTRFSFDKFELISSNV